MDASDSASIEALVHQAYRWILGREGDPGGVAHYCEALRNGVLDERGLRDAFVFSDEFRAFTTDPRLLVDVGGFSVFVEPNDPELGAYIAQHGGWEPNIRSLIQSLLPPGGVFVDVGANVGIMAFEAARIASKVIAFEPHPRNADNLRQGIVANGFGNVIIHQLGLSDSARLLGTTLATNAKVRDGGPNLIQAVTGDTVLASEGRIDLIKIDIEGHEPAAVAGMREAIARHHPTMLIEFNRDCLADMAGFAADLFSFARSIHATEGGTDRGEVFSATDLADIAVKSASHLDLIVRT